MTASRTHYRCHTFDCDDCGSMIDTGQALFERAKAHLKASGWVCIQSPSGWRHACPDCAPNHQTRIPSNWLEHTLPKD